MQETTWVFAGPANNNTHKNKNCREKLSSKQRTFFVHNPTNIDHTRAVSAARLGLFLDRILDRQLYFSSSV
jgi:hypothetical protein